MAAPRVVELFADCEACLLESGVVERYDPLAPACRFGVPAHARCRLCSVAHEAALAPASATLPSLEGTPANECPVCKATLAPSALDARRCPACGVGAVVRQVAAPRVLDAAGVEAALDAWAKEAGTTREELLRGTFVLADVAAIAAAVARGERLETVADPFARAAARPRRAPAPAPAPAAAPAPAPAPALAVEGPPSAPPRALLYPLVSVAAADGEIHPLEREIVDRFLASEGLAPLADDECAVHHPHDVARWVPRERRAALVELMCQIAMIDGLPDDAEMRVVYAYASAWHVPREHVDGWMAGYHRVNASLARQVWLAIRRVLLIGVWSARDRPG